MRALKGGLCQVREVRGSFPGKVGIDLGIVKRRWVAG